MRISKELIIHYKVNTLSISGNLSDYSEEQFLKLNTQKTKLTNGIL